MLHVVPSLLNDCYRSKFQNIDRLEVGEHIFGVNYNFKTGYLYNLEDMVKFFKITKDEMLVFSMENRMVLKARIPD